MRGLRLDAVCSFALQKPGAIEPPLLPPMPQQWQNIFGTDQRRGEKLRFSYLSEFIDGNAPCARCTGARRREWPHGADSSGKCYT